MVRFAVVVVVVTVALVGCGAKSAPPAAAVPATSPTPPPDPALAAAPADEDASSPRAGATASPIANDAGAPSAVTPNAPDDSSPAPDACIPAAAKLEVAARAAMRKCYEDAAKKTPGIAGSVRIAVRVDFHGKIASTKSIDKSTLSDKVVDCIGRAIKATPFDGGECQGRSMQMLHSYPR